MDFLQHSKQVYIRRKRIVTGASLKLLFCAVKLTKCGPDPAVRWYAACCLDVSVAGLAAHVTATRLRRQDLYFVMVTTSRAVQANFDLR